MQNELIGKNKLQFLTLKQIKYQFPFKIFSRDMILQKNLLKQQNIRIYNIKMKKRQRLIRRVLRESQSQIWDICRTTQWSVYYYIRARGQCVCGKKGLKKKYIIRNWKTKRNLRYIGSCCVKLFGCRRLNRQLRIFKKSNGMPTLDRWIRTGSINTNLVEFLQNQENNRQMQQQTQIETLNIENNLQSISNNIQSQSLVSVQLPLIPYLIKIQIKRQ